MSVACFTNVFHDLQKNVMGFRIVFHVPQRNDAVTFTCKLMKMHLQTRLPFVNIPAFICEYLRLAHEGATRVWLNVTMLHYIGTACSYVHYYKQQYSCDICSWVKIMLPCKVAQVSITTIAASCNQLLANTSATCHITEKASLQTSSVFNCNACNHTWQ